MKNRLTGKAAAIFMALASAGLIVSCAFGASEAMSIGRYKYDKERVEGLEQIQVLEDGLLLLSENEEAYLTGLAEYEAGLEAYAAGIVELEEGRETLAAGKATLSSGYSQYYAGVAEYQSGLAEYEAGRQLIEDNTDAYNEGKQQLEDYAAIYSVSKAVTNAYEESGLDLAVAGAVTGMLQEKVIDVYEDGLAQIQEYEDGLAQLEAGEAELAAGRARLSGTEAQLAAGESAVAAGESSVAAGEAELAAGAESLVSGRAQLAEFEDGSARAAEGMETLMHTGPIYCHNGENIAVEGVAHRLGGGGGLPLLGVYADAADTGTFSYWEMDESGNIAVKNGARYLNLEACLAACEAGREFIADQVADATREVINRLIVYGAGALSALVCLAASLVWLRGRRTKLALILASAAGVLAVGANIVGAFTDYAGYTYPLENGTYSGTLQFVSLAAFAIIVPVFAMYIASARREKITRA